MRKLKEKEEEAPVFGITTPLNSWNPVWANLHYYKILWDKINIIKHPAQKLQLLFKKPGWLPIENGGYQQPPKIAEIQIIKYDAKSSWQLHIYVFTQLLLTIAGLVAYMYYFEQLGLFYQVFIFGLIISSIVICCVVMENNPKNSKVSITDRRWGIPKTPFKRGRKSYGNQ